MGARRSFLRDIRALCPRLHRPDCSGSGPQFVTVFDFVTGRGHAFPQALRRSDAIQSRGSPGRCRCDSGLYDMHEIRTSVRRAPWGIKRYYAPLPVLSILLLTTALAAPNILRTNFLIYQDSGTTIVATVQQVVHMSGPMGKILGIASVTNTRAFPIQILALSAELTRDGTPDSQIDLTINVAADRFPINIAAGATVRIQFSGPFSGDLTTLLPGQTFTVTPNFSWSEMPPSGTVGAFSYTQAKDCTIPSSIDPLPLGGQWAVLCSS